MFNTQQEQLMFQPIELILQSIYPDFQIKELKKLPDYALLNQGFNHLNSNNKILKFVAQNNQMRFLNLGYEQRIYQHGLIATRHHNWHDFFNALAWHNFPQTKIAINTIHHQELLLQVGSQRSRQRDLLTLFDECGVIVIAENYILELIRNHSWRELFIENKIGWQENKIKIVTFGHAMFEKYLNPYIGMTAQALLMLPFDGDIDDYIAKRLLDKNLLKTKADLSPLPLLGIPSWHKNQDQDFYANSQYFR